MKYMRKRPSRMDQDTNVFEFAFCFEEMRLMLGILKDFHQKCPKIFETSQVRQRAKGMIKILKKTIREYKNEN